MPEIITTPTALVQTNNGKRFYVYCGRINVDTSDTTLISINDIGERDIWIGFNFGNTETSDQQCTFRFMSNDVEIFRRGTRAYYDQNLSVLGMILPANTSFEIIAIQSTNSSYWTVAAYGKYLSM